MDTAAVDFAALAIGIGVAAVIVAALAWADRGAIARRSWIVAAVLGGALITIGLLEILTSKPREVHIATILVGVPLPILSALALIRATRSMRRQWVRWSIIYVATLLLLFAGLLLGAAWIPRYFA